MSILILAFVGCGADSLVEEEVDDLRYLFGVATANRSGLARVELEIRDGDAAFLASVQPADPDADDLEVFVRRLTDPFGNDVLLASELTGTPFSKTNAIFVDRVSTLNWPISDEDGPLVPGTYELEIGVVDSELRFVREPVRTDVLVKSDADLDGGRLDVALIYTDGLENDAAVATAVQAATSQWRDLYATAGIEVRFSTLNVDEEGLLTPAFGEDDRIADLADMTPARTVNLILSDSIELTDLEILGIAGDIPGPLIPTSRSAVQLSMMMAAGADGSFDDLDTRILAETMAHETAHFMGLFHPVEREGWDTWDVLADTEECGSENRCVQQLGGNLMFPYPVCGVRTCTEQNGITADQRSVLNRALATR